MDITLQLKREWVFQESHFMVVNRFQALCVKAFGENMTKEDSSVDECRFSLRTSDSVAVVKKRLKKIMGELEKSIPDLKEKGVYQLKVSETTAPAKTETEEDEEKPDVLRDLQAILRQKGVTKDEDDQDDEEDEDEEDDEDEEKPDVLRDLEAMLRQGRSTAELTEEKKTEAEGGTPADVHAEVLSPSVTAVTEGGTPAETEAVLLWEIFSTTER